MTTPRLALLMAAAIVLSLAACDRRPSTPPDIDAAAEKAKDAAIAAGHKAAELAEKARDNTKAYFESPEVRQDAAKIKEKLKEAGGTLVSETDDAAITASVMAGLARDPELSARRIDVRTQGGVVQLSGPAPNAQAKTRAEDIAKAVTGVGAVDNQLQVVNAPG